MKEIGTVMFSNGAMYKVNDILFIGLADKNNRVEIQNCTIVKIFDDNMAEVKIPYVKDTAQVSLGILGYKRRHINQAIGFDFETNSFLTSLTE